MDKLKSRKLWVSVIGAVFLALNGHFGWMSTEDANRVVVLLATYVGGEAVRDAAHAIGSSK